MRQSRLFSVLLVAAVASASTILACGGDDGKGNSHVDARPGTDAKVFLDAAGSGSATAGIGQPCTPAAGSGGGPGQGDCAAGFVCLNLTGASHPWCSKTCTTGTGDTCATGYTGPGVASCLEQVTFGSGAPMNYCGVTCAGDGVNGCTAAKCTGTCPGQMACTGTLMNGSGMAVGSACN